MSSAAQHHRALRRRATGASETLAGAQHSGRDVHGAGEEAGRQLQAESTPCRPQPHSHVRDAAGVVLHAAAGEAARGERGVRHEKSHLTARRGVPDAHRAVLRAHHEGVGQGTGGASRCAGAEREREGEGAQRSAAARVWVAGNRAAAAPACRGCWNRARRRRLRRRAVVDATVRARAGPSHRHTPPATWATPGALTWAQVASSVLLGEKERPVMSPLCAGSGGRQLCATRFHTTSCAHAHASAREHSWRRG